MTHPPAHITVLAGKVRDMIRNGTVNPTSVMEIVVAVHALNPHWETVEDVVTEIAKGPDGIAGTADDLIPASTMSVLTILLRAGAVRDIALWLQNRTPSGCGSSFKRLFECFGR